MKAHAFAGCVAAAVLAACGSSTPVPSPQAALAARTGSAVPELRVEQVAHSTSPGRLTPADLQSAYDLTRSVKSKGGGQIVAIVTAFDNPDVGNDLAAYRSEFDLGAATFTKYNQEGQQYNYPQGSAGWGIESDASVDMVSASCPKCTIYLVEADSTAWTDLEAAEKEAVKLGAHIVSNGFNGSGGNSSYFDSRGVTYVAAGGDYGGEPATFPHVVAVGGTSLQQSSNKRGWTETNAGGPGACVSGVRKPRWQYLKGCKYLLVNQVAAAAENLAVYDSYEYSGWIRVDGTALSAPLIAGIFGLAGNATKQDGGRTFWERDHHRYLYAIGAGSFSCALVSGRYNTCTGWGSPKGVGAF